MTVTPADHGGGGRTRVEMWDGTKWVPETDWIAGFSEEVWKVVKESSAEYAKSEAAK